MPGLLDDPILRDVPTIEGFKVLAPCVLWDRVGAGGMGAVYLARHLNLDIDVAVKCLLSNYVAGDADSVLRFQREARVAARINHPNLVRVYDVLEAHNIHYLVMEYVKGETLAQRTKRRGPLTRDEAVVAMLGAARGIGELHMRTVVHRDVKPANILISVEGDVKVADFGLVRQHDKSEAITQSGTAFGTISYMPPEQFHDASKVGPPADVWSLGATMYQALTGEGAYPNSLGEAAIIGRILTTRFPDIGEKRDDLDAGFLSVLRRCNEKEESDRFADAGELVGALEELRNGHAVDLADPDIADLKPGIDIAEPPSKQITSVIYDRLKAGVAALPKPESEYPETAPLTMPAGAEAVATTIDPSMPVLQPVSDRPRSRAPLVLALLVLVLGGTAAGLWSAGMFDAKSQDDDSRRSAEKPDEPGPIRNDGAKPDEPETGNGDDGSSKPEPADPPPPDVDREAIVDAVRSVAAEVRRVDGYLKDIRVNQENIRDFQMAGGLESAIAAAQREIEKARGKVEERHANAVREFVVILDVATKYPEEVGRLLDDERKRGGGSALDDRVLDTIQALVAGTSESTEPLAKRARDGLADFFKEH